MSLAIRPVTTAADRRRFVDLLWEVYAGDPHWVPPLKSEELGLIDPGKNPWFEHARAKLWLAERGGKVVGRVSAQVDELVLERIWRDARVERIWDGTSEIQRHIVSRAMLRAHGG